VFIVTVQNDWVPEDPYVLGVNAGQAVVPAVFPVAEVQNTVPENLLALKANAPATNANTANADKKTFAFFIIILLFNL
jgi:hypothetical protein